MNTIDLIELAVLDALDMLDADESAEFDAAFRAAPPATQDRVLAEQSRLANLERLLPEVSPSPEMRSRVISAVREAMLADAVAKASEADDDDGPLSIRQSRGVARGWRIGAIGAAAAAVAFGVAFGHSTLRYNDLDDRFINNLALDGAINAYGAETMEMMLKPDLAKVIEFTPFDPESEIIVVLKYLDERDLGFMHCGHLPTVENVQYALVELDGDQIGPTIQQFAPSSGALTIQRLEGLVLENGMRLALISVTNGTKQVMATTTIAI